MFVETSFSKIQKTLSLENEFVFLTIVRLYQRKRKPTLMIFFSILDSIKASILFTVEYSKDIIPLIEILIKPNNAKILIILKDFS